MRGVSIVIVTWRPGGELARCLASLARAREAARGAVALDLIVVDNASPDFPEELVRRAWPDARVERLASNAGFGGAANRGAALARGEILLFLNPDTEALGEPFTPLAAALDGRPGRVAAAPRLVGTGEAEGEAQEEFQLRRLPTAGALARELLLFDRLFPRNRWRARQRYLDRDRDRPFPVEQPAAAALAVEADVFRRIGGFDARFAPAWWEDVDLCRRLLREGEIVYEPGARFAHRGGVSAERLGYDAFLPIYHRNAWRYVRKHHGAAAGAGYRALLAAGLALRLLLLPLRRADPRPKRESARAYWRSLGVALAPERSAGPAGPSCS